MPFPATGIFNGDAGYDPETLGLISLKGHFKDLFFCIPVLFNCFCCCKMPC